MTHIMPKYRVAITPTSEDDLYALEYAFEGKMAHGEHQECHDDVLVAALLGWHLRSIAPLNYTNIKSVIQEFYFRVNGLNDEWMGPDDKALRKNSRGLPSTPGNVLTIDGIDNKTLSRIEARAHAVKSMLIKLEEIVHNPESGDRSQSLNKLIAGYSDQAIMALTVWFVLILNLSSSHEVEEYPHWVKDEIQARGQAHAEDKAGVLVDEEQDGSMRFRGEEELPPLSPRERRAFMLRRRIHPGEKFWTDERVRAAMLMGL
jgi:hypothetical protein